MRGRGGEWTDERAIAAESFEKVRSSGRPSLSLYLSSPRCTATATPKMKRAANAAPKRTDAVVSGQWINRGNCTGNKRVGRFILSLSHFHSVHVWSVSTYRPLKSVEGDSHSMFRMLDSARILPPFSSSGGSGAILPNLAPRSFIVVVVVVVRSRSVVDSLSPLSIALLLLSPSYVPRSALLLFPAAAAAIEFCNESGGGVGVRGGAHVRIVRSHEEQERRGGERKGRGAAEAERLKE